MSLLQSLFRAALGLSSNNSHDHRRSPAHTPPTLELLEGRCLLSGGTGSIAFNFNGTPIPAGNTLWFTSVFKVSHLGASGGTIHFTNDTISFTANGVNYTLTAPNADVTLSPSATTASTAFNATTGTWETTLPMQFSGNAFLDGFAFPVTSNLPGGIKHVTWQGQFTSDTAGLAVNWQWAAAVYRRFGTDYNGLGVKPVDDNHLSNYQNADHAGSPEVYLPYVTGGATGGGGSNFTGSLSSTQQVTPDQSQINLSGYVMDTNGFAIEGAVLTLETTDSQGHTITYTASTDANGFYQFTNLIAGVYTETVTPPSPYYQPDSEQAGTVNGSTDGTDFGFGTLGNINLGAGNTGLNYNFILRQNQF